MLAIVETCGKQYEIQEGRYIDVEFLGKDENETLELDKVVMIVAGDQSQIGQPYLEGATVKVTVLKNGKDKKVLVYKQRRKKGYRNKNGHRQQFSRIMIESIDFPGKDSVLAAESSKETVIKTETKEKAPKAPKTTKKAPAKKVEKIEKVEAIETVETAVEVVETETEKEEN